MRYAWLVWRERGDYPGEPLFYDHEPKWDYFKVVKIEYQEVNT